MLNQQQVYWLLSVSFNWDLTVLHFSVYRSQLVPAGIPQLTVANFLARFMALSLWLLNSQSDNSSHPVEKGRKSIAVPFVHNICAPRDEIES